MTTREKQINIKTASKHTIRIANWIPRTHGGSERTPNPEIREITKDGVHEPKPMYGLWKNGITKPANEIPKIYLTTSFELQIATRERTECPGRFPNSENTTGIRGTLPRTNPTYGLENDGTTTVPK